MLMSSGQSKNTYFCSSIKNSNVLLHYVFHTGTHSKLQENSMRVKVFRKTGNRSFAVLQEAVVGIGGGLVDLQCSKISGEYENVLNRAWWFSSSDSFENNGLIEAEVKKLGPFCCKTKCFVNCHILFIKSQKQAPFARNVVQSLKPNLKRHRSVPMKWCFKTQKSMPFLREASWQAAGPWA